MAQKSLDVFEDEDLGPAFLDHTGELAEERPPGVLESLTLSDHRERLARRPSHEQVDLAKVGCGVQAVYVRVPLLFLDMVIGKIRLPALLVDVAGEDNLEIQSQALERVLDGPDAAEGRRQANFPLGVREPEVSPVDEKTFLVEKGRICVFFGHIV